MAKNRDKIYEVDTFLKHQQRKQERRELPIGEWPLDEDWDRSPDLPVPTETRSIDDANEAAQ